MPTGHLFAALEQRRARQTEHPEQAMEECEIGQREGDFKCHDAFYASVIGARLAFERVSGHHHGHQFEEGDRHPRCPHAAGSNARGLSGFSVVLAHGVDLLA